MSQPQVNEEPDDAPETEPSLQSLLSGMLGGEGGWADLDSKSLGQALAKQLDAQRQRLRKEALVFREAFSTPAGRKALQIMLDMTLRRTAWPVHQMADAQMLMAYGIWREAENSFVAAIIEAMAVADNHDVKPRSQT
jgi:hypothetical protein